MCANCTDLTTHGNQGAPYLVVAIVVVAAPPWQHYLGLNCIVWDKRAAW